MRTKHLFVSLALAGAFVGCSNEDFVSGNQSKMEDRPVVGAISLNVINEGVNSRLINQTSGTVDWTGMTIGAALMDNITNVSSADFYTKYTLTDKLYTNYPYARSESGNWDNDALMVEGNYFFYAPYNAALGRDKLSHTIQSVQYAYDNEAYNNLGMTATAPYLRHNAQDKNQLYVGYHGFKAGDEKTAIALNMAPAHSVFLVGLANEGEEDITIHKIVFNGNFKLQTNLDPTNTVNYNYVDAEGNAQVATSAQLNKRFDLLGKENVAYTHAQNPMAGAMDAADAVTSVSLVMPNYKLAAGQSLNPVHVILPANFDATSLTLSVYTNRGIMTKDVKATVAEVTSAADVKAAISETVHVAVGLRKVTFSEEGEEQSNWLANNAKFGALETNTDYQTTIAFDDDEANFVVTDELTVSNTAELEYYLNNWYAGKKTSEVNPIPVVNVTILSEEGVAINKAIYDYLCGTTNSAVRVVSGKLIIPNDATIPADAIMKMTTTGGKIVIAEGEEQTISYPTGVTSYYEFNNVIENNGILNVNTTDATDKVRIGGPGFTNNGTLNIKTPVQYGANSGNFTNNGVLNLDAKFEVTTLTNGSTTDKTVELTINADNDAIINLVNYGELNVNANVETVLSNQQIVEGTTPNLVYTNSKVALAAGKKLILKAGSVNYGDIEVEGVIEVQGNTVNAANVEGHEAYINVNGAGAELTVQNGTFTNNGNIETSGFIACNEGSAFDNNGELTLNEGSWTLVTNNNTNANITCTEINPELKIELTKTGYVTYVMDDVETDLSLRNLEINRLQITCSGNIDLTSIFACGGSSLDATSTLIKHIEITSSSVSTFSFAEATMLQSMKIGGANHKIKVVDDKDITAAAPYANKIGFSTESFEITSGTISVEDNTTIFAGNTVKNSGRVVVSGYFIATTAKSATAADGHNYILSTGGANRVLWNTAGTTWTCGNTDH